MKKILILCALTLPLLMFAEENKIGYLGVITEELSETMMKALDIENGLLIKDIVEDSPAEKAGLKNGDVILEIDGEKITDYATLKKVIAEKPDTKVKMQIKRGGKNHTKEVKLTSRIKPKFNIQMELPDFEEFKEIMDQGSKELKKELENLKKEIEILKQEIEDLKERISK